MPDFANIIADAKDSLTQANTAIAAFKDKIRQQNQECAPGLKQDEATLLELDRNQSLTVKLLDKEFAENLPIVLKQALEGMFVIAEKPEIQEPAASLSETPETERPTTGMGASAG